MTADLNVTVKTTQPLIALYCGSRSGNKPIYREKAIELAKGIAEQGFALCMRCQYWLMGQVADTVLEHHGEVVGVIPEFMLDYEVAHAQLTELHVVHTMHERKSMIRSRQRLRCLTWRFRHF
jgi:predicted Rossmann-fold nucleotide-binding protein